MLVRGQRNFLQTADFSAQAGGYAGAWAEKLPTDSRFLSPIRGICWCLGREIAYRQQISQSKPSVYCRVGREIAYRQQISLPKLGGMLVRGQINCLQTADFSVQAGQYAVARAEKIQNIRHIIDNISVQAGRYAVARAEKLPADSIFLSLSRAVCCREGREIFYRQQISLPKLGGMLVHGQKNFLQTADFSVQAWRILSCGQRKFRI